MNEIIYTIIEAAYIYYMYNIFKTSISINHPGEYILNNLPISDFFKHPMNNSVYENKICPLGHITSKLLVVWLFLRLWLVKYDKTRTKLANSVIFGLFFILSLLMNLNAFIYLIPIFIYEYLRY